MAPSVSNKPLCLLKLRLTRIPGKGAKNLRNLHQQSTFADNRNRRPSTRVGVRHSYTISASAVSKAGVRSAIYM